MSQLTDGFGREFRYLRLSVTDACNFRCVYCLPNGYKPDGCGEKLLSVEEIGHLAAGFAELGFTKIRLTGGEPTLRRDIVQIASTISALPGIQTVALSTNAWRLKKIGKDLRDAGVSALNISLDSLDAENFQKITGQSNFSEVIAGIDTALELGFPKVKLNAVLMRDLNHTEFSKFTDFVKHRPVAVRFIELMRTGENKEFFEKHWLSGEDLKAHLLSEGWTVKPRQLDDGPAVEMVHPDYAGRIGIIAPYSKDFCSTCNRLRVTSRGQLRLCLFGTGNVSLRPLLQRAEQRSMLIDTIQKAMHGKAVSHFLQDENFGDMKNLSTVGG